VVVAAVVVDLRQMKGENYTLKTNVE